MNGAVAIAEVLGIYGREGVDAAAYWRNPESGARATSPSRCTATTTMPGLPLRRRRRAARRRRTAARVSAFAAVDEAAGLVRLMLINKDPDGDRCDVAIAGHRTAAVGATLLLRSGRPRRRSSPARPTCRPRRAPAVSITVVEVPARQLTIGSPSRAT